MKFTGILPALVTPLTEEERINIPVLEQLMEALLAQGADGFYVAGATGEGLALRPEERRILAEESIRIAAGRVPCIHLKDHSFDRKMAVIGEGNINFDRVFYAAEKAGTEYMLVEQDDCNKENPFECLKRSYEFLKSRGFE